MNILSSQSRKNSKNAKSGKGGKISFVILLSITIGLSLVLSYFTFSHNRSIFIDNAGLSASVGGGLLAASDAGASGAGSDAGRSDQGGEKLSSPLGSHGGSLDTFLMKLLDVVILLGAIVIVFMIILSGLRYVLAKGDENEIKSAHKQLTWTAVGAAILLGAKVIAMVITNTVETLSG